MIFVTVGTSSWDFTRLLKEMDRIAGITDEEVIMQIGTNQYEPAHAKYFRYESNERIDGLYESARVVVSHAGVGCIISAMKYKKLNIVVPRRAMYKEHFDDHQVEIASQLEGDGKIIVAWDIKELEGLLMGDGRDRRISNEDNRLVLALKSYVNSLQPAARTSEN